MPRRSQPAKQPKPESPSIVHRFATTISDWRVLVGALIGVASLGGVAFAFVGKLATKEDIAPLQAHIAAHDVEFGAMKQALDDIRDTVHQLYDDERAQSLPRRR